MEVAAKLERTEANVAKTSAENRSRRCDRSQVIWGEAEIARKQILNNINFA